MLNGGNTTIFVSDMDQAIRFYTQVLGLKLRMRAENYWAEIDAGPGLILGLHPSNSPHSPKPGMQGSINIGFNVDEPIETVIAALEENGVEFPRPVVDDGNVRLAFFTDPDGTPLYLAQVMHAGAHGGP